jgi:Flp pilus assembly protein TadG
MRASVMGGRRARRRGQGLIELGLVIIILLVVTFGLIQYGMLYNAALALNNLAREGARIAAVKVRDAPRGTDGKPDLNAFRQSIADVVRARAAGTPINEGDMSLSNVIVEPTLDTTGQFVYGQPVRVTINYDLKRNHAFVPVYVPARWATYRASAANLME